MLSARVPDLKAEDGSSMVEVMVGLAMGMVVLAGLSMLLIVTVRGNARISARVEASDNARVMMTRIMEELHSACVEPATSPIYPGSTENTLIFKHGPYGGTITPNAPVTKTEIAYSPTEHKLWQTDNGVKSLLLSNVSPGTGKPIFEYSNTTVQEQPFHTPLGVQESNYTIQVEVAFKESPKSQPVADAGAATEIANSAILRLTPPTYEEGKWAKPCE
jgi:Tfp pilus assembly protein PilW